MLTKLGSLFVLAVALIALGGSAVGAYTSPVNKEPPRLLAATMLTMCDEPLGFIVTEPSGRTTSLPYEDLSQAGADALLEVPKDNRLKVDIVPPEGCTPIT